MLRVSEHQTILCSGFRWFEHQTIGPVYQWCGNFYPSEEYLAFKYRTIYVQFSNGMVFKLPLYCYSDLEPNPLLSIAQGKSKIGQLTYGLHQRV